VRKKAQGAEETGGRGALQLRELAPVREGRARQVGDGCEKREDRESHKKKGTLSG